MRVSERVSLLFDASHSFFFHQRVSALLPSHTHTHSLSLSLDLSLDLSLSPCATAKSEHSEFVSLSAAFRHGHISAFDYARGCSRLLGNQFERVFADLVVLLPDLTTQQALVDAWVRLHRPVAQVRVRKRGSAQGKPQAKGQAGKVENPLWARCQFCHQVVAPDDLREHETHHDLAVEHEFPSLLHVPKHKGKKALPKAWRK